MILENLIPNEFLELMNRIGPTIGDPRALNYIAFVLIAPKALFRRGGCTAIGNFGFRAVDFVEVFEARLKNTPFEF